MPKFKYEKTKDFTIMSNCHFKDKRLSLKSMGLLCFMLSLPESWNYSLAGLETILKDGRDSINSAIHDLEKYGYLKRETLRDSKGRYIDVEYTIYEIPRTGGAVETVDKSEP
ncbi:MAG: helix-turn-helix domain-containing protein, partial [Oscillospiraceae bacterium]|nr:helix-turn-helix domain-containing protein [Oscillospiraceae bacterium]